MCFRTWVQAAAKRSCQAKPSTNHKLRLTALKMIFMEDVDEKSGRKFMSGMRQMEKIVIPTLSG